MATETTSRITPPTISMTAMDENAPFIVNFGVQTYKYKYIVTYLGQKSKQKTQNYPPSPAASASHRRAKTAALDTSGSVWASCITTMVQRGLSAG